MKRQIEAEYKLAVLMYIDIDESTLLHIFNNCKSNIHFKVIQNLGSEAMLEFRSVKDSIDFAINSIHETDKKNQDCRMGLHIGEINDNEQELALRYAELIEIPARIANSSRETGVYVSESIKEQLMNIDNTEFRCQFIKSIPSNSINVYKL